MVKKWLGEVTDTGARTSHSSNPGGNSNQVSQEALFRLQRPTPDQGIGVMQTTGDIQTQQQGQPTQGHKWPVETQCREVAPQGPGRRYWALNVNFGKKFLNRDSLRVTVNISEKVKVTMWLNMDKSTVYDPYLHLNLSGSNLLSTVIKDQKLSKHDQIWYKVLLGITKRVCTLSIIRYQSTEPWLKVAGNNTRIWWHQEWMMTSPH